MPAAQDPGDAALSVDALNLLRGATERMTPTGKARHALVVVEEEHGRLALSLSVGLHLSELYVFDEADLARSNRDLLDEVFAIRASALRRLEGGAPCSESTT